MADLIIQFTSYEGEYIMTTYSAVISGLNLIKQGKVRDIYDMGDSLLMVTSDRISAFDVIMDQPVPDKGVVLTQISLYWFELMKDLVPNHIITGNVDEFPAVCQPYKEQLKGRSILVKKCEPLAIECVVRGYITGSGWKSYKADGTVCGIKLPEGLKESQQLPEPIFTPSTKEELGAHDENIDFETAASIVGRETAEKVRDLSLAIYKKGAEIAATRGIIIADTKFEFGLYNGEIILIDEVLTPDSSRFWPADKYEAGHGQESFDKQYLRDYLESIDWNKQPPPPVLPEDVIKNTRAKYVEALRYITGENYGL